MKKNKLSCINYNKYLHNKHLFSMFTWIYYNVYANLCQLSNLIKVSPLLYLTFCIFNSDNLKTHRLKRHLVKSWWFSTWNFELMLSNYSSPLPTMLSTNATPAFSVIMLFFQSADIYLQRSVHTHTHTQTKAGCFCCCFLFSFFCLFPPLLFITLFFCVWGGGGDAARG